MFGRATASEVRVISSNDYLTTTTYSSYCRTTTVVLVLVPCGRPASLYRSILRMSSHCHCVGVTLSVRRRKHACFSTVICQFYHIVIVILIVL